jgi:hypothetical protein
MQPSYKIYTTLVCIQDTKRSRHNSSNRFVPGARNFLLSGVPAIDLAPETINNGPIAQANAKAALEAWNTDLQQLANDFEESHLDVAMYYVDMVGGATFHTFHSFSFQL